MASGIQTTKAAFRRADKRLAEGNYREIARRARLHPVHVSRVLRGVRGASFHVAARIAVAAGVTLDQLYAHVLASPSLNIKGRRTTADLMRSKRRLFKRGDVPNSLLEQSVMV